MKAWHILAPSDSKHTRTTLVTVTSFRPGVRTPCSVVFFFLWYHHGPGMSCRDSFSYTTTCFVPIFKIVSNIFFKTKIKVFVWHGGHPRPFLYLRWIPRCWLGNEGYELRMLNASCAFVWKQGTPKSCVLSSFPPLEFGVIDRLTPFFFPQGISTPRPGVSHVGLGLFSSGSCWWRQWCQLPFRTPPWSDLEFAVANPWCR